LPLYKSILAHPCSFKYEFALGLPVLFIGTKAHIFLDLRVVLA